MSFGLMILLIFILGLGIWHSLKYQRILADRMEQVRIMESAFEHTALGMAIISPDFRFMKVNQAYADIVGYTRTEMLRMVPKDFVYPEDHEKDTPYTQEVFAGNIHSFTSLKRYVHKNGNILWIRATFSAVRNKSGNIKYFVAQIQDMTIAKKAEDELRKSRDDAEVLARTDYLTNTLNRRAFIERLKEELERTRRTQKGFAMILVDVDYFKKVNDHYGHLAGDYVLQQFAECLGNIIRAYDFIGRYGGEEFIICLPDTGIEQATMVAERMRESVEALEVDYLDSLIKVTGSFGVAAYDSHSSDTLDELIERADSAMYMAKHHKNTVYQWVS
ncbi:MAG TPA: diguanylate cyclase [Desulfitobacterium dehalogenans]|uniref:Diguanylate cyclase n=1 Tax=Desulfitobacterium dehalogenans TaxID=36854 RepID=A0A7C7D6U0_9FIRM|nr:diguanylate cyclase [Desulfitobacterium dehalogenans]